MKPQNISSLSNQQIGRANQSNTLTGLGPPPGVNINKASYSCIDPGDTDNLDDGDSSNIVINRKFEHNQLRPKSVSQSMLSRLESINHNLEHMGLENVSFNEDRELLDKINKNNTKLENWHQEQWKLDILKKMSLKKPHRDKYTQTEGKKELTVVEQAMEDAKAEVMKDIYGKKKIKYDSKKTETNPIDFPDPPLTLELLEMEKANQEITVQLRVDEELKLRLLVEYEKLDALSNKIQMEGLETLMLETKFSSFLYGQLTDFERCSDKLSYFKKHPVDMIEA